MDPEKQSLDHILSLRIEDFLERRLQTIVFKKGLAKSIHHARILIRQRHIRVGKQIVNSPSFMVRVDAEKHIGIAPTSSLAGAKLGRVKKKKARAEKEKKEGEENAE